MTDLCYHLFCTRHWAGSFKHCYKGTILYPFFSHRNRDQNTKQHVCDYFPNILIRYRRVTKLPKTSWKFKPGSGMHFPPSWLRAFCFWVGACSVTQPCLTVCDPMACRLPGSSVHGIFQARILEWVVIFFSRGAYQVRDQTRVSWVSCIARPILYHWTTWKTSLLLSSPADWCFSMFLGFLILAAD